MAKSQVANLVNQTLDQTIDSVTSKTIKLHVGLMDYILRAKEAGFDNDSIMQLITSYQVVNRIAYGVEGIIVSEKDTSVQGGISYTIVTAMGAYGSNKKESARLKIDLECMNLGAPELRKIVEWDQNQLIQAMTINKETLARISDFNLIQFRENHTVETEEN